MLPIEDFNLINKKETNIHDFIFIIFFFNEMNK